MPYSDGHSNLASLPRLQKNSPSIPFSTSYHPTYVRHQSGNFERAVEFFTEGLELDEEHPALYTNRSAAYLKMEK